MNGEWTNWFFYHIQHTQQSFTTLYYEKLQVSVWHSQELAKTSKVCSQVLMWIFSISVVMTTEFYWVEFQIFRLLWQLIGQFKKTITISRGNKFMKEKSF